MQHARLKACGGQAGTQRIDIMFGDRLICHHCGRAGAHVTIGQQRAHMGQQSVADADVVRCRDASCRRAHRDARHVRNFGVARQRGEHIFDNFVRRSLSRVDLERNRSVSLPPFMQQRANALLLGIRIAREQRTRIRGGHPAHDLLYGRGQADNRSAFGQRVAAARIDQRAAARANDQPLLLRQLIAEADLREAKGRLALFGENFGDGLAKMGHKLLVHINERPPQPRRQQATDRTLPRAHKTG